MIRRVDGRQFSADAAKGRQSTPRPARFTAPARTTLVEDRFESINSNVAQYWGQIQFARFAELTMEPRICLEPAIYLNLLEGKTTTPGKPAKGAKKGPRPIPERGPRGLFL